MKYLIFSLLCLPIQSTFAYDQGGCEELDEIVYRCRKVINSNVDRAQFKVKKAEVCIGLGDQARGLYIKSENLSEGLSNWKYRDILNLTKNNRSTLSFQDKSSSLTGCIMNPGSACYRKHSATLNKRDLTLEFNLKFSTKRIFRGWTSDVHIKLKCEKL